jgi:hypothetical protein
MLKDIKEYEAEGVGIAIVQEWEEKVGDIVYNVYLINLNNTVIEGVLVLSKGFGILDGEERKTSILRHFLDTVDAESFCKIEPINHELFALNNQYQLTYFLGGKMYEKTYLFKCNIVHPDNYKQVPLLKKPGVLII